MIATNEHYDPNKILFFTWDAIYEACGVVQKWHRPRKLTDDEYREEIGRIPRDVCPFAPEPVFFPDLLAPEAKDLRYLSGMRIEDARDPDPDRRHKEIVLHSCGKDGFPEVPPWTRCFYTRTSPDGETWSDPVPMADMGETGDTGAFLYDERAGLYRLTTRSRGYWIPNDKVPEFLRQPRKKGMPEGRWISMTTSEDFVHWSPLDIIINKDPKDEESTQFYCMMPFPYGDIYLGLLRRFNGWEGTMDTELIWSPDCVRWRRAYNRMAFTEPGDIGEFDFCFGNLANERPFRCGDTLYFACEGRNHIHAPFRCEGMRELDMTISVVTLRVDGFVSIDAGSFGGRMTTEPLPVAGKQVFLNARTVKDGFVKVALLSPDLELLDVEPCHFDGDDIAAPLRFGGAERLPASSDGNLRLRIEMKNAALYALATADGE